MPPFACMPLVLAPLNNGGRSHTFEPVVVVRVRVQTEKVQIPNIRTFGAGRPQKHVMFDRRTFFGSAKEIEGS